MKGTKRKRNWQRIKSPFLHRRWTRLRAEENEIEPYLVFTIKDERGEIVRKLTKSVSEGISRLTWNFRYPSASPVRVEEKFDPMSMGGDGMFVLPGKYTISMAQVFRGEMKELAGPVEFIAKPLNNTTLPAEDRAELVAFQQKLSELGRVVREREDFANDLMERIRSDKQAAQRTPEAGMELMKKIEKVETQMDNILWKFNGQQAKPARKKTCRPCLPLTTGCIPSFIHITVLQQELLKPKEMAMTS